MLSNLLILGAAATVAATTSEACMQFCVTKKEKAIFAVLAAVTSPLWIVPALGYGAVALAGEAKRGIRNAGNPAEANTSAVGGNGEYWRKNQQDSKVKEFFAKAEKEPTPQNLFQCGMHFLLCEDLNHARQYLRRAVALAKQDPNYEKNLAVLPIVALAQFQNGQLKMRLNLFEQALQDFEDTLHIVANLLGNGEDRKKAATEIAGSNAADGTADALDVRQISISLNFAKLCVAIYNNDGSYTSRFESTDANAYNKIQALRLKDIDDATAELSKLAASFQEESTEKYDALLKAAIAVFYQNANRYAYFVGVDRPNLGTPGLDVQIKRRFDEQEARAKAFREIVLPKFTALTDGLAANAGSLDKEDLTQTLAFAEIYKSRIYFVIHDRQNASESVGQAKELLKSSDLGYDYTDSFQILFHINKGFTTNNPADPDKKSLLVERLSNTCLAKHAFDIKTIDASGNEPHYWWEKKVHKPSTCQKCCKMLDFGEVGFECFYCYARVHKQCYEELGNHAPCVARGADNMGNHQHILRERTLKSPHFCSFCTKLIKNFWSGALACECGIFVHTDCAAKMRNVIVAEEKK